jgi:hypothetical protein
MMIPRAFQLLIAWLNSKLDYIGGIDDSPGDNENCASTLCSMHDVVTFMLPSSGDFTDDTMIPHAPSVI